MKIKDVIKSTTDKKLDVMRMDYEWRYSKTQVNKKPKVKIINGRKILVTENKRKTVKMMDCSLKELQGFFDHCVSMIHNPKNGRLAIISSIQDIIDNAMVTYINKKSTEEDWVVSSEVINSGDTLLSDIGGKHQSVDTLMLSISAETYKNLSMKESDFNLNEFGHSLYKNPIMISSKERKRLAKQYPNDNANVKLKKYLNLPLIPKIRKDGIPLENYMLIRKLAENNKVKYSELNFNELEVLVDYLLGLTEIYIQSCEDWYRLSEQVKEVAEYKLSVKEDGTFDSSQMKFNPELIVN